MVLEPTTGDGRVVEHEAGASGVAAVVDTILDQRLVIDVLAAREPHRS
jgi:hypothetical protein